MLSITNSAGMASALASPLDADLKRLLVLRRDQLTANGTRHLGDDVQFIVVEPGDHIGAIEAAAGAPIATNFVDGTRLGDPDFTDNFEWVERHPGGWCEAALVLTDDFTVVLLVPDRPDTDAALLALLRRHG